MAVLKRPGNLKILNRAPFFQNGATSGFKMCVGLGPAAPKGAGAKTRLESRIKNFTPHCVCRPVEHDYIKSKSGFEMCFDIGSRHLGCWGQNTSRIQHNEVFTPPDLWIFLIQAVVTVLASTAGRCGRRLRTAAEPVNHIIHHGPLCKMAPNSQAVMM